MQQIRGMKRNTYNPSHVVRKRRHGYLSRIKTRTGRMTLKRRRMKKRSTLSH
jgi:large subunit ribosomal protein L34